MKILDDKSNVRTLTPLECWRLMGFEDTDFEKVRSINSDTQLYKQAGNSIVVGVLEAVLKSLLEGGRNEDRRETTQEARSVESDAGRNGDDVSM